MVQTTNSGLVYSSSKLVKYEYDNLQRAKKLPRDHKNKFLIVRHWELELHKQKLAIQMDMNDATLYNKKYYNR